jgi:hypothetical protein
MRKGRKHGSRLLMKVRRANIACLLLAYFLSLLILGIFREEAEAGRVINSRAD